MDNLAPFLGALLGMVLVCVTLALCYQHAGETRGIFGNVNFWERQVPTWWCAFRLFCSWHGRSDHVERLTSLVTPLLT